MILLLLFFRPRLNLVLAFVAAFLWSSLHQWWVMDQGLPKKIMIPRAELTGYVESIPNVSTSKTQFQFAVDSLNAHPVRANLLLSCFDHCPDLKVGEYWFVQAKINRARNIGNPGSFDYVSWLQARHIQWIGSTKSRTFRLILQHSQQNRLLALRQHLAYQLENLNLNEKTLGILQALTLGITTHLHQSEWDLFRHTGTTHLMVISGAHIGLMAGVGFSLTKWIWCRMGRICLRIPAQKAAAVVAMLMALCYALLSGFAVPAQRSLFACLFMFIRYFINQRFTQWQAWRYGLLIVLCLEPHAVLLPGLYLSFLAVAILIVINQRFQVTGLGKVFVIQLGCLFGLMPLSLFWFAYGAVNGLAANLAAIPWVGFVLVPLSLVTALLGQWFEISLLTSMLHFAVDVMLDYLNWVDSLSGMNLSFQYYQIISPLALMIAMSILVFLPIRHLRGAILILGLVGVFPKYPRVQAGEARMSVLDVGQGLAIVVQTADHQLIYDTGPKFYRGSDMGARTIIPYLRSQGIRSLDKIIISHPDLDHRGGLASIEKAFHVKQLIVDNPTFYKKGYSCHRHPDWTWDGVIFHFFSIADNLKSKNNTSCVLQVKNQAGSWLLTGDIEQPAEQYLVTTYKSQLKSSVMIVPHHGSKTSSTPSFLETVAPIYAIVSYGLGNRYHFPHRSILKNYRQRNIQVINTVDCGMVTVLLGDTIDMLKPTCSRL